MSGNGSRGLNRGPVAPQPVGSRVLAISNCFPPNVSGGYERMCAVAVARWAEQGHEVTVLTVREAAPEVHGRARIRRALPPPPGERYAGRGGRAIATLWHARSARIIRDVLRDGRPDVVVTWGTHGLSRAVVATAFNAGVPALAIAYDYALIDHLVATEPPPRSGPLMDIYRRVVDSASPWQRARGPERHPDRWVFCSKFVQGQYERALGPLQNAAVVYHGVDVPAARPPLRPREKRLRVGAVARMVPEKGLHTLIAAAAELARADRESAPAVTIRGHQDPADASYLRRFHGAAADAIANGAVLEIGGPLSAQEYPAWLASMDCIVAPAEWDEPFALVPVEAMAMGRPLVGTNRGGAAELLKHEVNALVVRSGDPHDLALALHRLTADPALGPRLAAAAFEQVTRMHKRKGMEDAIDAALAQTLRRTPRGGRTWRAAFR